MENLFCLFFTTELLIRFVAFCRSAEQLNKEPLQCMAFDQLTLAGPKTFTANLIPLPHFALRQQGNSHWGKASSVTGAKVLLAPKAGRTCEESVGKALHFGKLWPQDRKRDCCRDFWFVFDCVINIYMIGETWLGVTKRRVQLKACSDLFELVRCQVPGELLQPSHEHLPFCFFSA